MDDDRVSSSLETPTRLPSFIMTPSVRYRPVHQGMPDALSYKGYWAEKETRFQQAMDRHTGRRRGAARWIESELAPGARECMTVAGGGHGDVVLGGGGEQRVLPVARCVEGCVSCVVRGRAPPFRRRAPIRSGDSGRRVWCGWR
jgi:hypothetical protein